jgi:large subunit ribosomal protein L18Ae
LNKLKRANGEILAVNEIFEKSTRHIKTYAIVVRYQSRTGNHNMYKEYRDVSLNGAISQMYLEMSGRHRARHETLHIVRTAVLRKAEDIRRTPSLIYRDEKLRFPITKFIPRSSEKRFRTVFKANRPTTVKK